LPFRGNNPLGVNELSVGELRYLNSSEIKFVRRPQFQFSIRSVLLAFVGLSVFFAWFANQLSEAAQQRDAVSTLHALGQSHGNHMFVLYDWAWEWKRTPSNERAGGVSRPVGFHRDLLGHDLFDAVVSVSMSGAQIDDKSLDVLQRLPHLQHLSISLTNISPIALARFARESKLESISVTYCYWPEDVCDELRRAAPETQWSFSASCQ
jgi:hypothetical protein